MRRNATHTVTIFIGVLLIVIFVVGLTTAGNSGAFNRRYHYDYAMEQFVAFCGKWWLPAGIIGIPMFLFSLIHSLIRESKDKE